MKRIFSAPSSTPFPLLYLEMGMIPLKYIIQARRLMFLRYILTQEEDSLLLKFFNAQRREPCKIDWVTTVLNDLETLELDYSTYCPLTLTWSLPKKICQKENFPPGGTSVDPLTTATCTVNNFLRQIPARSVWPR